MEHYTLAGNPPVEVQLRRSARARRLSLRVSRLDGRVTLTLPKRLKLREATDFIEERADWIRGHLGEIGWAERPRFGGAVPIEGEMVTLIPGPGRRPERQGAALVLPDDPARVAARTAAYLKTLARERLAEATARHSAALGLPHGKLTLRDTRSRWGSCTHRGDLMYSWRLIMAPPEVLDYVAAHEVAHLKEHNHSPAFWATCHALCPETDRHRAWLKSEGHRLHRYRFD